MLHNTRAFQIVTGKSPEHLAEALTSMTWTLCTAFEMDDLLFANDSFNEDGAQEYAVLRILARHPETGTLRVEQVESITFSWCDAAKALAYINESPAWDAIARPFEIRTHPAQERCRFCA